MTKQTSLSFIMAQQFWDAASDLISVTEKHPFLVNMVNGTLDMDKFRYYVIQDALYLTDFADSLRRLGNCEGISNQDSKRLHDFAKGAEETADLAHVITLGTRPYYLLDEMESSELKEKLGESFICRCSQFVTRDCLI